MNKVSPTKEERDEKQKMVGVVPFELSPAFRAPITTSALTLTDWDIGLFEFGNPHRCFTCCCPGLALAQARTNMDGSDLCFNICCLFPPVTLWLIHSAYGVPCTYEHILQICCFSNCYINRVYQTTVNRGNPNKNFRGREKNTAKLNHAACPDCVCSSCFLACAFPCCYSCYKLQEHLNMPCWITCFVFPWTAQNLLRYQYGVAGDYPLFVFLNIECFIFLVVHRARLLLFDLFTGSDCWDECFPGFMWWAFFGGSLIFLPIVSGTKGLLVVQSCEKQMAKQQSAGGIPTKRYLSTEAGSAFSPLSCGL
ncbi:hypothetical protein EON65_52850 [archaeon]|nr:MAG: hypothetical protein EON65_52850 [archaeon]